MNSGLQPSLRTRLGPGGGQESSPSPSPCRTSWAQGMGQARASARHDPIHQQQPRGDPHRSLEQQEGSASLANTACISSLSCTPFKFRPEQHSKGITVVDCGVQGNPQLHNKRDRKGCQWGSKDISTFKGCSCSQKTCSGITPVPWVPADSRAPAGHSPWPGYPALQGKGLPGGCFRGAAEPRQIPWRFLCSAEHQAGAANIARTAENRLGVTLQSAVSPGHPGRCSRTPRQRRSLFPGSCTSAASLPSFSRQGLHSRCFPRESLLSPNSQECQFTLLSDELRLALLLSGELCSAAGLKQQEAACQRQGERFLLFRQTALPGCPC